jgi:hypothetical protein
MLKLFDYKLVAILFNYIYRLNNYDWIQDKSVEGENFDGEKIKE